MTDRRGPWHRTAVLRVRASARPLVQASLAAPLAWLVATRLLDHPAPIFAPISAIVSIGVVVGQPWLRAVEIVVGVSIGVAIADAVVLGVGQGTWQIGVLVLLTMATSVFFGGSPTFVVQAGVAATLVASLPSQAGEASFSRVLDTLAGGLAALLLSVVVLPVRPLRMARRAAQPVLRELAATFEDVGEALRDTDPGRAERALARARATGDHWARLNEAVGVGRQAARLAPVRRREAPELVDLAQCVTQLDFAIRDARILARVAWRLTETGYPSGPRLELSMREFATAVRALDGHLDRRFDSTLEARGAARAAARIAAAAPVHDDDLVFSHLVGQIRSTTVDLLRATGMSRDEAITEMLESVAEGRGEQHSG